MIYACHLFAKFPKMTTAVAPSPGSTKAKDVPWYHEEIKESDFPEKTFEILEKYSGIPHDQVIPHVTSIVRFFLVHTAYELY